MKIIGIIVFALTASTLQAAGETLIIVERDTAIGLEQTSIQAAGDRLTFVTNSNFLQSEKAKSHLLGMFEAPAPDLAKELSALASKSIPKAPKKLHVSPHNLRVRINSKPVPLGTKLHDDVVALVTKAAERGDWTAKDAALVSREGGVKVQKLAYGSRVSEPKVDKNLDCAKSASPLPLCSVKGFGYVHQ